MRYWAIQLLGGLQRLLAIVMLIVGAAIFVLAVTAMDTLNQQLSQSSPLLSGAYAVALAAICAIVGALFSAIGLVAAAQLLDLLMSIDENLKGLRRDVRERRRNED